MAALSLVTVSLNAGPLLNQTVQSVLEQTFEDWELIIKDGGSSDGSIEALPRDSRIKVSVTSDRGIYDAMNQGTKLTTTSFVNFLNAGDLLTNVSSLAKVQQALTDHPDTLFLYSDFFDQTKQAIVKAPSEVSRKYLFYSSLCHQTQWLPRKSINALTGFRTHFQVRADHDLAIRHLFTDQQTLKNRCHYIPEPIITYDGSGYSSLKSTRSLLDSEMKLLQQEHFSASENTRYRLLQPLRLRWLKRFIKDCLSS